jgi:hypothetical protein
MKLLLKILFFLLAIFQTNIIEAKVFVFSNAVSEISFTNDNVESINEPTKVSENDFCISCKSWRNLLDYSNLVLSSEATAAKRCYCTNRYRGRFY